VAVFLVPESGIKPALTVALVISLGFGITYLVCSFFQGSATNRFVAFPAEIDAGEMKNERFAFCILTSDNVKQTYLSISIINQYRRPYNRITTNERVTLAISTLRKRENRFIKSKAPSTQKHTAAHTAL
jgi:hypothetical protein